MINCFYDSYRVLNKVYSEKAFVKQALTETDIELKNKALTTKICYGVLDRDTELSYYISVLCEKNPKLAIRTILKICFYAIKYLNKKPYAVIDNAVTLTKKLGKQGASGFVNAVLRKFVSANLELPKDLDNYLSVKYSYPEFAVNVLLEKYGGKRTEEIIKQREVKTTLVFYDTDGERYLTEKGVKFQKTPFYNVFLVENFTRNEDYDKGVYTYQALGSIAICEIVEPCEKILDCCSAPGGKSIRLSYKCKSVTSCDVHEHRVGLINAYKTRMNRQNITERVLDATIFNKEYENAFDGVLIDAPCSGLGVVNDNPDIKLNRTENSIKELNETQLKILLNASKYVKKGGNLYYSTCSILPLENENIIKVFLAKNESFYCEEITSLIPHEKSEKGITFMPDISGGLGFYVCKLKRKL